MDPGHEITRQTREAGYQAVLPFAGGIRERVVEALRPHPAGLTAEEVAEHAACTLNSARSRLTELLEDRVVQVLGKRPSARSGVTVAVWGLRP